MGRITPFNPLDKINLAKSVGAALAEVDPAPLGELERFEGSGVYSLYYTGDFYAYKPLAEVNRVEVTAPIYVGKAVTAGARKGGGFIASDAVGEALYKRLSDHAKSVNQATNLSIEDFMCRYLVVDDLWIPLGESLLISQYSPVWNVLVEGFGNHDPGKGRHAGARPLWDMLHPGRSWADRLTPNSKNATQIGQEALQYLAERHAVIDLPWGEKINYRVIKNPEAED